MTEQERNYASVTILDGGTISTHGSSVMSCWKETFVIDEFEVGVLRGTYSVCGSSFG